MTAALLNPDRALPALQVAAIISTKGGVGKTTSAANLGAFAADAGLRVLLLDLDVQPTASSFFPLAVRAQSGIYEMLAFNERRIDRLASHTVVSGLHVVLSNDVNGDLSNLLLNAADGRLRLRHLLPWLAPHYDLVLIDTQGARSVLLEMAVLASTFAVSPIPAEFLAARELRRGTLQLFEDIAPYRLLGIPVPPLHLLINRVTAVSTDTRLIRQTLRKVYADLPGIRVLDTEVPELEAYPRAATRQEPVHRIEYRKPTRRVAPAAISTMRALATELFPQWHDRFEQVTGKERPLIKVGGRRHGG